MQESEDQTPQLLDFSISGQVRVSLRIWAIQFFRVHKMNFPETLSEEYIEDLLF